MQRYENDVDQCPHTESAKTEQFADALLPVAQIESAKYSSQRSQISSATFAPDYPLTDRHRNHRVWCLWVVPLSICSRASNCIWAAFGMSDCRDTGDPIAPNSLICGMEHSNSVIVSVNQSGLLLTYSIAWPNCNYLSTCTDAPTVPFANNIDMSSFAETLGRPVNLQHNVFDVAKLRHSAECSKPQQVIAYIAGNICIASDQQLLSIDARIVEIAFDARKR